ncbi:hypothetical protein CBF36_12030 [Vagococcus bubulae]|uniref:Uncharacterized protein n=1 Tax=Vagococcus bubulae TaxID=1977868 RepID=A0A429Z9W3_9ENTE|nr:hypothetical protein CBF36_12030 [Vagococcus bubulae]
MAKMATSGLLIHTNQRLINQPKVIQQLVEQALQVTPLSLKTKMVKNLVKAQLVKIRHLTLQLIAH